jgi:hypothetical protein
MEAGMDKTMTKDELLATMRAERARWEALLAEVGEGRMEEEGATGHWTVKDVVAHVMWFEQWVVDRLEERAQGKPYVESELDAMYFHDRNAVIYDLHHGRPLADVLADGRRIFEKLYRWAERLTEEELQNPGLMPDFPADWPGWKTFENMSYQHIERHMVPVRAWLAGESQQQGEAVG